MAADHYCTLADVNTLVAQVPFTDTSKPSASQVTTIIEDTANDMDSVLANVGYVSPVVQGASALKWLRRTCVFGALGIAQAVRDTGVTTAVNASGKEAKNIWLQLYEQRMKALVDAQDKTLLNDAPATSEQKETQGDQVLRSFVQGVTDDPSYDPTVAPEVQRYQVL